MEITVAGVILAPVMAVDVVGYKVIEGWSLFAALYMTIIVITTVGYGGVHPLSIGGCVFTISLIMWALGIIRYSE